MDRIALISVNTEKTRRMTKSLLAGIPDGLWYNVPEVVASCIAWQAGHIVFTEIFHAITLVSGIHPDVKASVPFKEYLALYGPGTKPANWPPGSAHSPETLRAHMDVVRKAAAEVLAGLEDADLDKPVENLKFPHPVVRSKFDALMWNCGHETWHCGQIALIRRVLGVPAKLPY